MITGVQIQEFKILKGIEFPIHDRFTICVGPNGSGKSTLLTAIWLSAKTRGPTLPERLVGSVRIEEPTLVEYYPEGMRIGWDSSAMQAIVESCSSGEELHEARSFPFLELLRTWSKSTSRYSRWAVEFRLEGTWGAGEMGHGCLSGGDRSEDAAVLWVVVGEGSAAVCGD